MNDLHLQDLQEKLNSFQRLAELEERAIPKRLNEGRTRLRIQKEREAELQEEYKRKALLRDDLTVRLGVMQAARWSHVCFD